MAKRNNKIPDGWEEISNIGSVVEGTRFIAFRVPLSWRRDWNLARLKETVRAETGQELTHIIDLTATDRYNVFKADRGQLTAAGSTIYVQPRET